MTGFSPTAATLVVETIIARAMTAAVVRPKRTIVVSIFMSLHMSRDKDGAGIVQSP
jgi:hypothetical protein